MDDPRFFAEVVAAEKVLLAAHAHVGRRHRDVSVPGKIVRGIISGRLIVRWRFVFRHSLSATSCVIHAVIMIRTQRESAHRPLRMVRHVTRVLWEKRLVLLMHPGRDIRPPEESLHVIGAVVCAGFQLQHGSSRMQANAVHPLHAGHRVVLAEPHRGRTIGVMFDGNIRRHEGGWPVMLRPVELDSSADPRTGKSDECRFDDRLIVNHVVAIRLVDHPVDAAAERGQDHHFEKLVLDENGLPIMRHRLLRDAIIERQRIDFAGRTLIDPFLQEHRIFVRSRG